MKTHTALRVLSLCFSLLCFLTINAFAAVPLSSYQGTWTNSNSNTKGITKIEITVIGKTPKVQVWGSCVPTDCDWGVVTARAYGTTVRDDVSKNTKAIIAEFQGAIHNTVILTWDSRGFLRVQAFTYFSDSRTPYVSSDIFKRGTSLAVPKLIAPAEGATFNHYPRNTTLQWGPVSGAQYYLVEIDCYHCCVAGKWCADTPNGVYREEKVMNATSFTFNWVGANQGRWRVAAVSNTGQKSPFSAWRNFKYTR